MEVLGTSDSQERTAEVHLPPNEKTAWNDWQSVDFSALPVLPIEDCLLHPIASMQEFGTLEEFVRRSNNFWARFDASFCMGFAWYRDPCMRRLATLHPSLYLETLLRVSRLRFVSTPGCYDMLADPQFPWELLYEAYRKMSQLVSPDDPHVIREPGGNADHFYLCG